MGQGGFLWIINATTKKFKKIYEHSYQMESWSFKDIPKQSMERFYIEYNEGIFKNKCDDAGEATFEIEGTNKHFQLQVRWPFKEEECGLKVDWSAFGGAQDYSVFPPPPSSGNIGELGWFHNGTLSLLVMENGAKNSVATALPGASSIVTSVSTIPYPLTFLYDEWMNYYSNMLGKLTLTQITLPGTHDSGTHDPVSAVGALWIRTQYETLAAQLHDGVRVLDLRIGQNSPGDYLIVHDTWRTSYSLSQALKEVTNFIDATNKEIVILDMHRFVNLGDGNYDYNQLKAQIKSDLSGYYLPVGEGQGKTLKDIWSTCGKKRIVVAWNKSNPDSYMWPGVNQCWYSDADTLEKLYGCIKSDMSNPPSGMWAACSFMTSGAFSTPISNATATDPTITNWYFGGSKFCGEKANIISVDFFRQCSNIVQASIIGSLLKAGAV